MTFKPGQSGNPNGRPRKKRALATIVETVGNSKGADGTPRKRLLAETIYDAAITGKWNNKAIVFREWLDLIAWLANHTDGPVPQDLQTDHGGEVVLRVEYGSGRDDHTAETAAPKAK